MAAASLMQSPLWQTAGWVMLHFLWVGGAIGLFAALGRLLLPNNPARRYAFALGCFAALFVAPGFIIVRLLLDGPPTSTSSRQMAVPLAAAEGDLAPPVHGLD